MLSLAQVIPTIRNTVYGALHHSGWNHLAVARRTGQALVLGYHGVLSSPRRYPFRYHHTVEEFSAHLDWLGKRFTPINLAGFEAWEKQERTFKKPPLLITFDDGYRNNLTIAAPLLKEKGFPAVFFLSTGFIGTDRILWPEETFLRLMALEQAEIEGPDGTMIVLPVDQTGRTSAVYRSIALCKNSEDEKRQAFLDRLRLLTAKFNVRIDAEAQDFLSWDEVRTLMGRGFEIGSHTVTHPILSRIAAERLSFELKESKRLIEMETGTPCQSLAYPNGGPKDYNEAVQLEAARCGYRQAFVVSGLWNKPSNASLAIERVLPAGHANLEVFTYQVGARK